MRFESESMKPSGYVVIGAIAYYVLATGAMHFLNRELDPVVWPRPIQQGCHSRNLRQSKAEMLVVTLLRTARIVTDAVSLANRVGQRE